MAKHNVYQFYAELEDYKPKIWRKFQITGSRTIAELGYTLMTLFEVRASHLFCFIEDKKQAFQDEMLKKYSKKDLKRVLGKQNMHTLVSNVRYELRLENAFDFLEDFSDEVVVEANKVTLQSVANSLPFHLTFLYDFGDDWSINLKLENIEKKDVSLSTLPQVIDGEGYGIIEDVGGTPGLEEFAIAMKKGKGVAYKHYTEWLGVSSFDLTHFDKEDMNFRLKKLIRIYRDIYEKHAYPTQKSINLIERKYIKK